MAPCITLLVDPKRPLLNLHVAKTLQKYYPCFADGENYQVLLMKRKYHGANCKFFGLDSDEWLMYDLDTVECIDPSFVVSFDVGKRIARNEWTTILKWVRKIFEGEDDYELNEAVRELIPLPVLLPEKVTAVNQIERKCTEQDKEYFFKYEVDDEYDRALFEVKKPFTDLPYTAVIRNFKERGFLPFFTALYVCTSWGVCSTDHQFLVRLWDHLNMKSKYGELDLEQRLKENIERCLPREDYVPEPEPEVYRKSIMEVKEFWAGKQKRLDDLDVDSGERKRFKE